MAPRLDLDAIPLGHHDVPGDDPPDATNRLPRSELSVGQRRLVFVLADPGSWGLAGSRGWEQDLDAPPGDDLYHAPAQRSDEEVECGCAEDSGSCSGSEESPRQESCAGGKGNEVSAGLKGITRAVIDRPPSGRRSGSGRGHAKDGQGQKPTTEEGNLFPPYVVHEMPDWLNVNWDLDFYPPDPPSSGDDTDPTNETSGTGPVPNQPAPTSPETHGTQTVPTSPDPPDEATVTEIEHNAGETGPWQQPDVPDSLLDDNPFDDDDDTVVVDFPGVTDTSGDDDYVDQTVDEPSTSGSQPTGGDDTGDVPTVEAGSQFWQEWIQEWKDFLAPWKAFCAELDDHWYHFYLKLCRSQDPTATFSWNGTDCTRKSYLSMKNHGSVDIHSNYACTGKDGKPVPLPIVDGVLIR